MTKLLVINNLKKVFLLYTKHTYTHKKNQPQTKQKKSTKQFPKHQFIDLEVLK